MFKTSELGFGGPVGIWLDGNGLAYVCDRSNSCISVFTSEGQLLTSFGKFVYLGGLAVDSGMLYVCDINNCCVQLYKALV